MGLKLSTSQPRQMRESSKARLTAPASRSRRCASTHPFGAGARGAGRIRDPSRRGASALKASKLPLKPLQSPLKGLKPLFILGLEAFKPFKPLKSPFKPFKPPFKPLKPLKPPLKPLKPPFSLALKPQRSSSPLKRLKPPLKPLKPPFSLPFEGVKRGLKRVQKVN